MKDTIEELFRGTAALCERRDVRLALFGALALALMWPALGQAAYLNQFRDAHVLFSYEKVAVLSALHYHQVPLWNPYYCGGLYLLGAPQARFAAPTFLLSLVFGPQRAIPIIALVCIVVGMEGAYLYARDRTAHVWGPLLAAPAFALSGLFALSYFKGWINFFGFELLPLALYGTARAARGSLCGVAVVAASFALIVAFGGTYAGPLAAVLAAIEGVAAFIAVCFAKRKAVQPLAYLSAAVLFSLALSAFRLWPVLETMSASHRIMAGTPGHTWHELYKAAFHLAEPRFGELELPGQFFFYVPLLAMAPLALFRKWGWFAGAMAALCVWAATGYHGTTSPFVLLRHLPIFDVLRYPERFLLPAALFGVLAMAIGVDVLAGWSSRGRLYRRGVLLVPVFLAAAGFSNEIVNFHKVTKAMTLSPPPAARAEDFKQARGNRWLLAYYAPMNRGSLSCWEAYPVRESAALRADLLAEERFAEPSTGSVQRVSWSPNRIVLDVTAKRPGLVLINQNYHPGWRSDGSDVVDHDGLLGVKVPSGKRQVVVRFLPRSAVGGFAVSLLALVGFGYLFARRRKGPLGLPLLLGVSAAPLALGVLVRVAMPQPPMPVAPVQNANGQPAFIPKLPPDAQPVGARFANGARLQGVKLPQHLDPVGNARFELYWKRQGPVSRDVGVFVQLEGQRVWKPLQHQAIAASMYFSDLPGGQLVRDAFSVNLGGNQGRPIKVYVGLWRMSGDQSRVAVTDPGKAKASKNRLLVGTLDLR